MGKFVGWKCDVCGNAEDGNDAPVTWLRLRLPSNGSDNTRDFCSDPCLLRFARGRNGDGRLNSGKKEKASQELLDFLTANGVKASHKGTMFGNHVRRRHEVAGMVDDCLVCEFLTTKGG